MTLRTRTAAVLAAALLSLIPLPRTISAQTALNALDGHWAQADLTCLEDARVLDAAHLSPQAVDAPMTRAMAAELWVRALRRSDDVQALQGIKPPYSDVAADDPFAPYISLAWEMGLMIGDPDGTFRPADPLSRLEMTVMAVRASHLAQTGQLQRPATQPTQALPFRDAASVASWGRASVTEALTANLVQGYPDGTFRPNASVTLAESATLAARVMREDGLLYQVGGRASTVGPALAVAGFDGQTSRWSASSLPADLFLNGQPAAPSDLMPGDEIGMVVDAASTVRCLEAYRTAWRGTVAKVQGQGLVLASGPSRWLPVASNVLINGQPASISDVQAGQAVVAVWSPARAAVVLLDALTSSLDGSVVSVRGNQLAVDAHQGTVQTVAIAPTAIILLNGQRTTVDALQKADFVRLQASQTGEIEVVDAWRGVDWR